MESGRKCPECGHVDEDCRNCGSTFSDDSWLCSSCQVIRSFCPECGSRLGEDGCPNCGVKKPATCAQCQAKIDPDVTECPECGYAPGERKRKIGTGIQAVGGIVLLYGGYEVATLFSQVSQYDSAGATTFVVMIAVTFLVFAGVLIGGGTLAKRSAGDESPVS